MRASGCLGRSLQCVTRRQSSGSPDCSRPPPAPPSPSPPCRCRARRPRPAIPRTADGKPDLNGIWQALNTANWDIEAHTARPALAMRPGPVVPVPAKEVVAFGAVGAVPSGVGVVVGGEIPYLPEARKKKDENQAKWLTSDPGDQVLPAGRAARHLHAVPVPDLPEPVGVLHRLRVRRRGAQHLPEGSGSAAGRHLDGPVGRAAGTATRSSSPPTASTIRAGSIAPATTTAKR